MSDVARVFRVEGRVQGVGFRWWTRQQAEELGVRGTVRNLPDGSVEVTAAGKEEQLMKLEHRLKEGPLTSHVSSVRSTPGTDGGAIGFVISG